MLKVQLEGKGIEWNEYLFWNGGQQRLDAFQLCKRKEQARINAIAQEQKKKRPEYFNFTRENASFDSC